MSLARMALLIFALAAFGACKGPGQPATGDDSGGGDDAPGDAPDVPPDVPADSGAGVDSDGVIRIYPPTSSAAIPMEYGARHENGDRYNANHKFINYEVTGYYLTANTELIEMKTDGPNHSGCDELPRCEWAEPRIEIADAHASISSEYPHPVNHPDSACPSCMMLGSSLASRWIGYKVIAYQSPDGFRIYEQWLDPDGLDAQKKPVNHWTRMMIEKNTGQIIPNPMRMLPTDGAGLEAEIRCHNGHETEMRFGKIQEIVPPS